jgi:hypothetical protein
LIATQDKSDMKIPVDSKSTLSPPPNHIDDDLALTIASSLAKRSTTTSVNVYRTLAIPNAVNG